MEKFCAKHIDQKTHVTVLRVWFPSAFLEARLSSLSSMWQCGVLLGFDDSEDNGYSGSRQEEATIQPITATA